MLKDLAVSAPTSDINCDASMNDLNGDNSDEADATVSSSSILLNGISAISNHSFTHDKQLTSEAISRNGAKTKESDSHPDSKWVEQGEPGVYITCTALPGGTKDLKRVRFSRKRFSEKQAEQWWSENWSNRVYEQYNVHMVDKSNASSVSEDLAL